MCDFIAELVLAALRLTATTGNLVASAKERLLAQIVSLRIVNLIDFMFTLALYYRCQALFVGLLHLNSVATMLGTFTDLLMCYLCPQLRPKDATAAWKLHCVGVSIQ